jgi:hypothetical protein
MCEGCHEQAFTCEQTFSGTHQFVEKSSTTLCAAVTEDGFHLDAVVHVHERSGFGDHRFLWVEFYFHTLHFLTENSVVDFVI